MRGGCLADGRLDALVIVRDDGIARRLAAPFAHLGRQHERVVFDNVARLEAILIDLLDRHQFRAGRDDRHARLAAHVDRRMSAPGNRAQVNRRQDMIGRQHQFGGDHVLAHRAHRCPRRDAGLNLDATAGGLIADGLRLLDHDDGIGPGGKRIAGVHVLRLSARTKLESHRRGLRRAERVGRAHGVAIHRAGVIARRRKRRPHRPGRHAAQRLVEWNILAGERGPRACALHRGDEASPGFVQRNVF